MPFNYFGQPITQDNVEIVGGMTGADGMCRPTQYNVFVFVAGRFAGTLSPALMTSREDGSSGAVRLAPPGITVEFARYAPRDPLCCPSARATVRFRIDRTAAGALVVPIDVAAARTDAALIVRRVLMRTCGFGPAVHRHRGRPQRQEHPEPDVRTASVRGLERLRHEADGQ